MKNGFLVPLAILCLTLSMSQCTSPLKKELAETARDWNYVLPMPSSNDSINLLFIRAEKSWYLFKTDQSDSLCDVMLSIDSTCHQALSFKAWVPLNLTYLNRAMALARSDTSVHRLVLEADYAYWVNGDTATAIRKFKEVYDRYPNSHTASWCLGQAYLWAGHFNKAIEQYQRCLAISPVFPRANQMLGWAYYMTGDFQKSAENFMLSFSYGNHDEWDLRYAAKAFGKLRNMGEEQRLKAKADSIAGLI
ncbi:MAG: tetratricopeptide repeat protein [Bacteroidota bacterium]